MEFKCHEQIENQLIMKKLKNKLKQLSIQNAAVCNCHNVCIDSSKTFIDNTKYMTVK